MAEGLNLQRFRNPWALQLQKLGLELKCPTWYCTCFPKYLKFRVSFVHIDGIENKLQFLSFHLLSDSFFTSLLTAVFFFPCWFAA